MYLRCKPIMTISLVLRYLIMTLQTWPDIGANCKSKHKLSHFLSYEYESYIKVDLLNETITKMYQASRHLQKWRRCLDCDKIFQSQAQSPFVVDMMSSWWCQRWRTDGQTDRQTESLITSLNCDLLPACYDFFIHL